MDKDKGISKKVYIGNIPYTANKEEVESLLRIVGPVINFELNYDKEAGKEKKHKGFGFCEYPDYETVLSAIRNLNDLEFQSRTLRVSFEAKAEQTLAAKGLKTDSTDFDSANFEMKNEGKGVTEILSGLDVPQKYFIMRELKNIKELAEPELKVMLAANPKLSLEILKMQKELGLDNTQQFEKKKKSETPLAANTKPEKKMKNMIKKKTSPKKISKNPPPGQERPFKDFPKQKMKPIDKPQDHFMDPYHPYPETVNNNNSLMKNQEMARPYVTEQPTLFPPNQNNPSNRMFYNVNQTLMMDFQNSQNQGYHNENLMNRGYPPQAMHTQTIPSQNNINNVPPQNFMRNNPHPMNQAYPQNLFMNFPQENEKKWTVADSMYDNNESHFFGNNNNNNKGFMENEKIKKKMNFPQNNFHRQNNNNFFPKKFQEGFDDKGENYMANEQEFSPVDVHVTDELKNILYEDLN